MSCIGVRDGLLFWQLKSAGFRGAVRVDDIVEIRFPSRAWVASLPLVPYVATTVVSGLLSHHTSILDLFFGRVFVLVSMVPLALALWFGLERVDIALRSGRRVRLPLTDLGYPHIAEAKERLRSMGESLRPGSGDSASAGSLSLTHGAEDWSCGGFSVVAEQKQDPEEAQETPNNPLHLTGPAHPVLERDSVGRPRR